MKKETLYVFNFKENQADRQSAICQSFLGNRTVVCLRLK